MRDKSDKSTRALQLGAVATMTVKEAFGLFSSGVVDQWEVSREFDGGYLVKVRASKQGAEWLIRAVKAKDGEFRVFQSLDAAVSAVLSCGFKVESFGGGVL